MPRTLDGHPDIEGDWNYAATTPLERPPQFEGRPFMSDAEAAALTREPLSRAINDFWSERGSLARIDGRVPTSLVVDPPDGRLPAATPAAQARAAQRSAVRGRFDAPTDFSLSERCLRSASGPPLLPGAPDANLIRIVQSRDHVALVQEKFHETRIVRLDGRPHVSPSIRAWVGDSTGRWVGETLVVETTNFTEKVALQSRYDGNLRLVERFTRTGSDTLLYEFTVHDPTAFTKEWSVMLPMRRTGEQLFEFACHEGNYSLPNILRGARFEERP